MKAFWRTLYAGYGEPPTLNVRQMSGRGMRSEFWPMLRLLAELERHVDRPLIDLYFAVCPRRGTDASKAGVESVPALWVDLDCYDDKDAGLARLMAHEPQPSIIVDSGGGYHAYWVLRALSRDFQRCEAIMRGLGRALGGDSTHDVSRILRVPGTLNGKRETRAPCKVVHITDDRHELDALAPAIDVAAEPIAGECVSALIRRLPRWARYLLETDKLEHTDSRDGRVREYASRSERDLALVNVMVWLRWSDGQIQAAFEDEAAGSKYREQGNGWRYLGYSLAKARRDVEPVEEEREPFTSTSDAALAVTLLEDLQGDGPPLAHDEGDLWRYEAGKGLWVAVDQSAQSRIVQSYDGHPYMAGVGRDGELQVKPTRINAGKVKGTIALAGDRAASPGHFADAPAGVCCQNGFLRVSAEGARIETYRPEHRARAAASWAYMPTEVPRRWVQFLGEVFPGDDSLARQLLLQQFAGACLIGVAPIYERCLVLHGSGRNGKSVAMDVISALFPVGTVCALRPQRFDDDRMIGVLVGKRLNAAGEIPDGNITGSDRFKTTVSGQRLTARPPYSLPITFHPRCGHIFACNSLPGTSDTSPGYWRRFMLLAFDADFEGNQQEKGLTDRLVREELPGIASWAIEGAVMLLTQGEYSVPRSSRDGMLQWKYNADAVLAFTTEECDECAASVGATTKELHGSYKAWCERYGYRCLALNRFGTRLTAIGKGSVKTGGVRRVPLRIKDSPTNVGWH